jgi:hypothetical protein
MTTKIAEYVLIAFGYGLTLFLIKFWIKSLDKKVDVFIESHHACQKELPERFGKREDVKELYGRVDAVEGEVRYLNGIRNGAVAGGGS